MHSIIALYEEIEQKYPDAVKQRTLKRNEALISKGQVEKYGYIILKGAVRVIHFNGHKAQNIRFGYEGSFISSLPSFFDGSPSQFSIEAIRKTEVKCFSRDTFFKVLKESDYAVDTLLELTSSLCNHFVQREIDLLTTSPKDLYERVMKRSPLLFQEIPALHIANYLGMSAEHLSRLRKS